MSVIPTVTATVAPTVSATASPVGTAYGPNLLTNSYFSSDLSGWTLGGGTPDWVWADSNGAGVALMFGSIASGTRTLSQTITVEDGAQYQIDCGMVKGSAGDIHINAEGGTVISATTAEGGVTKTGTFTAVGTSATVSIETVDLASYLDNIDWITVRKTP